MISAAEGELRIVEQVPLAFVGLVEQESPASMALSGGNTARQCYELLATADLDWGGFEAWFSDERWVPIHDPDSNEGMARVAFLDQVEPRAIHSMRAAGETIDAAANAYDAEVGAAPAIEIIHLGLGTDGHTASLFPNASALNVMDRLVVAAGDDVHPQPRLTFTYPAIARGQLVVFTVAGEEKREALRRVLAGDDVPATRVRADRIVWLLDEAARGPA